MDLELEPDLELGLGWVWVGFVGGGEFLYIFFARALVWIWCCYLTGGGLMVAQLGQVYFDG